MKTYLKLLSVICTVIFFNSCGNADDDVNFDISQAGSLGLGEAVDQCLDLGENDLVLSIQDQFTSLPAKVSVFFKVSDKTGSPMPGLTAEQFTIYEQGRNDECFNTISASESFARISPNSQIFNNSTLLVLDLSNSVLSNSLDELKSATSSFITNVMPETEEDSFKMAIYWFDGEDKLHLLNPLTASREELIAAVEEISATISNDPSTDLYGAVIKSSNIASDLLLENTNNNTIGATSVVVFTDGTDQASRYSEEEALQKVNESDSNISYFAIGLGSEIDTEILMKIGKTSSVFAGSTEELETTFNDISLRVNEQANSFYLFEYCTPKRDGSGENNLVIHVKNGDLQGGVQTKFDTTGFTGGCQ
ncbi:MAG: VWA domain-containing protein [Flavobacteriaceae bacterium]|nr:MAG: VWA domain-containing protein [Flavobacteriaceae bacterium]